LAKRQGECVYCGTFGPLTRDHVPPRCLFGRGNAPPNLITVPSCESCNAARKRDDEYFRLALTLRQEVGDEPDVQSILPAVLRSLHHVEAEGLQRAFLAGVHPVERVSPAGLYLGRTMAYNVDQARLDSVASRITQGLYYRHKGHRLPSGYEAKAFAATGFKQDRETFDNMYRVLGPLVENAEPVSIGRIFSYVHSFNADDPGESVFLMLFYRGVVFIGMTSRTPV
jgi:hypothetical protein